MTDNSITPVPDSPRWGAFTKFLVALIFVVIIGALIVRFRDLVVPLILALILAYQLDPIVRWLTAHTRLSRGMWVNLLYLMLLILLAAGLVLAGIAIVQQLTALYQNVIKLTEDLPGRIQQWLRTPLVCGPFTIDLSRPIVVGGIQIIDFSTADWGALYAQLLDAIKPLLSRSGAFIGSLASSTVSVIGWIIFVVLVSYYCLHTLPEVQLWLEHLVPEGYVPDLRRLFAELGPVWNAFLRGQAVLSLVMGALVTLTMAALQVRYWLVLGLLAGLLEFVPIIGPFITGAAAVIIAMFQGENILGLKPIYFALVVLGVFLILQQLENNFLVPPIMGKTLKLHPAVILVGAIIGASLGGMLGLLLAAPIIASLRLFGHYARCKMFDMPPWPDVPLPSPPPPPPPPRWYEMLKRWRKWRRDKTK